MSSILSNLEGLATRSAGEALAFGLGFALGRALEPAGVELAQEAWKVAPIRAPDAGTLAAGVAQGQVDPDKAAEWAKAHGYGDEQFGALVDVANVGPALGAAYSAWRRGELTDEEFVTALRRTGLEPQWNSAMMALKDELLEPGEIAKALHRGNMRGEGLLVAEPSAAPGKVPMVPTSTLDPAVEAAGHGFNHERLRVLTANAGLPPAPGELLQLLNRGEITVDDYSRGVGQSNLRNEWGPALMTLRRHLLTPHQYAELRVRGWIDTAAMHEGAALSGVTADDTELLFKLLGRPIALHAVTMGLARGGTYDGPADAIPEAYLRSLEQGNMRPEWYNLAFAGRYTYPGAFVLRSLTQAGELSETETHSILLYEGWEPTLAAKVAAQWAGGGKAKADPLISKAETQLWAAIHGAYVDSHATDAEARQALAALGATDPAADAVLELWQRERSVTRAALTAGQIKKAAGTELLTEADALERLDQLGYTATDSHILLYE